MLSLACLDSIFSMEQRRSQWLGYLSSRGYLQHIIESLAHDDQELQAMLQPQPQPLKALYIFESKMVGTFIFSSIKEKWFLGLLRSTGSQMSKCLRCMLCGEDDLRNSLIIH